MFPGTTSTSPRAAAPSVDHAGGPDAPPPAIRVRVEAQSLARGDRLVQEHGQLRGAAHGATTGEVVQLAARAQALRHRRQLVAHGGPDVALGRIVAAVDDRERRPDEDGNQHGEDTDDGEDTQQAAVTALVVVAAVLVVLVELVEGGIEVPVPERREGVRITPDWGVRLVHGSLQPRQHGD